MKKNAAYYLEDLTRLVEVSKKELLEWESEEPYYQPIKYLIEKKNEMLGLPMYDSRVASAAHNIEELRAEGILTDDDKDTGKESFSSLQPEHVLEEETTSLDSHKESQKPISEDSGTDDVDSSLEFCESDTSSSETVQYEEKACEITSTRGIDLYTKTTNETEVESVEREETIASLSDNSDNKASIVDTNIGSIQDSPAIERSSVEIDSGSEEVVDRLGLSLYTSRESVDTSTDESIKEELTIEDTEEEVFTSVPADYELETDHIASMYDLRAESSKKDEKKKSKKKKDKKQKDKKQKKKEECTKAKSKKSSKSKPKKKTAKATETPVIQESQTSIHATTGSKPLDVDFLAWLRSKSIERLEDEKSKKKKKNKKKKKKSKEQKLIKEANRSTYRDTTVISETLAKILADQGHKSEAIEMYEQLSLLITEKSTYFAAKIKELKNS